MFLLCLGSLTYGYTFSITSTTLGQPGFYTYFGMTQVPTDPHYSYTNSIIGAMNGLFAAGGFIGALTVAWTADRFGRKGSLWIATPIAIVAGALQGGAAHIAMFLVGRILGGLAVGMLVVLIPIYQAEIAPPAVRGFLVGHHGFVLVFGYSSAAWIGFACFYAKNLNFQWRFPLCVQCLWPTLMLILAFFIPESPRWLLMKDRTDEAWEVTAKLHGSANDPASEKGIFAREEFYEMKEQVRADVAKASRESLLDLFRIPSYRKRMITSFFVMFGAQSTGILVIYNYSVLLYEGLGESNAIALLLAAAYVTVACIGNYICAWLVDIFGRRKLFITGITGCLINLIFETALTARYVGAAGPPNKAGLSAAVFFLFFYISFYGVCIDANTFIYCSELWPTHLRARGMGWSMSVFLLSALAYLEAAPTAFANISWKYYLLFIILTAINLPFIFMTFKETKGLMLEEIGELFGDEVVVHMSDLHDGKGDLAGVVDYVEDHHAAGEKRA